MADVGDEQIYRLRDFDRSRRVRVLTVERKKKSSRYEIEFLDDEDAGKRENVPGSRLRGPWSGVCDYDEMMANWERLSASGLSEVEQAAAETVFIKLIPPEVAEWEWSTLVRWVTTIHKPDVLERLIGIPVAEFLAQIESCLRGWCGHRAVTMQERLAAAEAEVQRLDVLITRLIDQMKGQDHSIFAEVMERVLEEERITAANYRPVVDRPLKPSEIPVRYERAPRRWGH